jgi:hypothetical protein
MAIHTSFAGSPATGYTATAAEATATSDIWTLTVSVTCARLTP